jgi:hypothetical protein
MTEHLGTTATAATDRPQLQADDGVGRRGFLGLAGLTAALGVTIPFARHIPQGLVPAAFAQTPRTMPRCWPRRARTRACR